MKPLVYVVILLVLAVAVLAAVLAMKKKAAPKACPCGCCGGVDLVKTVIGVEGMSCEHCASRVETAFMELGMEAVISLEEKTVTVLSGEPLDETKIRTMIENLGFVPGGFSHE